MGTLANEFRMAYLNGSGPGLAAVLTPIATRDDPDRLRSFYNFSNPAYLNKDLSSSLFHGKTPKVSKAEQNAWVDIFAAFWETVGEVLKFEAGHPGASAVAIFTAWKKVANAIIRGYSTASGLPAWTLPCLYTVGKYLRTFAIKADLQVASQGSSSLGFQDDLAADFEKNANLEDAARVINRMFTLCLGDRYVFGLPRFMKEKSLIVDNIIALPLKSLGSGESTIPPTCFSRPISRQGIMYLSPLAGLLADTL